MSSPLPSHLYSQCSHNSAHRPVGKCAHNPGCMQQDACQSSGGTSFLSLRHAAHAHAIVGGQLYIKHILLNDGHQAITALVTSSQPCANEGSFRAVKREIAQRWPCTPPRLTRKPVQSPNTHSTALLQSSGADLALVDRPPYGGGGGQGDGTAETVTSILMPVGALRFDCAFDQSGRNPAGPLRAFLECRELGFALGRSSSPPPRTPPRILLPITTRRAGVVADVHVLVKCSPRWPRPAIQS